MTDRTDAFADGPAPHDDLGAYVLGGLTPDEQQAFERAMATDPELRRHVDELRGLPDLLSLAALVDGDGADDVGVPAVVVPLARRDDGARRQAGTAPRTRRPMVAAAAVALLLGTVAGALATRDRSPGPDRTVALALPAGTSGSNAKGTAQLFRHTDGVGVRLRMNGLTPNDDGSHYECWWVGANGRVAAGSFRVGADGAADVQLTVAASLDGPFRLNVNRVTGAGAETNVLTASVA